MLEIHDTGLMPEGELSTRNMEQPSFDFVHSNNYPVEKILYAATISTMRDKTKLDQIIEFMPLVFALGTFLLGYMLQEDIKPKQKSP